LDGDSRKSPGFSLGSNRSEQTLIDYSFPANSVIEMHTFLVTLVRQFDFSLPDNGQEIRTLRRGLIMPVVTGEEQKGPQLPLMVTALRDE